ncbi:MAG TPA: M20/M25/M40 family metallo-hydrolase, partial [Acetobacteraceae bacterium]|nr:M20/M25/M40 family metallo-hydrolase [Acetobacteraceae bacterium]
MDPDATLRAVTEAASFNAAVAALAADHDRMVADIVALAEIPAPPFQEAERAKAWMRMAAAQGLSELRRDAEGNVTALRRGAGAGDLLCVAAHLDTVFPPETDVRVRRRGTRLLGPGIGDNTRSLSVLLAFARAMDQAGVRTRGDILFVADVGEEGVGDLRGMRHLFQRGDYAGRIGAFITIDSPDMNGIATRGIGSRRYRVTFNGPGGHSWAAFGMVNPMHALARVITQLASIPVPVSPRTTFCASRAGGGTSINAIPNSVWGEFDLRSEAAEALDDLDRRFLQLLGDAAREENALRAGCVRAEIARIGDRPAGRTEDSHFLPRLASAAIAQYGFTPRFEAASTDANIPMSLGIPAIKIGSGGT